ncbi:MAG: TldD/PmbA family protein [Promethearchaeota archaeon]
MEIMDALQDTIDYGENLGADFVIARMDDVNIHMMTRVNDIWRDITGMNRRGLGITCYYKGAVGYSFLTSINKKYVRNAIQRAFKVAKASEPYVSSPMFIEEIQPVQKHQSDIFKVKQPMYEHSKLEKMEIINSILNNFTKSADHIQSKEGYIHERYSKKVVATSDRSFIEWELEVLELKCVLHARTSSGESIEAIKHFGGTLGFEIFNSKHFSPDTIVDDLNKSLKEQLNSKPCPAGNHRALIDHTLSGALAHESFGHLAEADWIIGGISPLKGRIGEEVGKEKVTIIDSGCPDIEKGKGGIWVPFDDQGIRKKDTSIVERGVLNNYLHDRSTAQKLDQFPTGNSRAIHYGYAPIPRMTNTYFAPGDLNEEEALEMLKTGVYAKFQCGGSAEFNGNFMFKAAEGYWIEKGKIQTPLRGITISGSVFDVLAQIMGITNDFALIGYVWGCGKRDQHGLSVGLGGPQLVLESITFGGV